MHNPFAIVPIKGIASPASKDKPLEGGKWKIVEEFNGKSHEDGGIDIEVIGGTVRRIHAPYDKPDEIAKKGKFWKNIAVGAYGVGEGLLDTATGGLTDQLTDVGFEALQDVSKNSESDLREQRSIRGYGTAAGAGLGIYLTGGKQTASGVQQAAKGIGAGVGEGSPDSKFAQAVGTYLPIAGQVAGAIIGGNYMGAARAGLSAFTAEEDRKNKNKKGVDEKAMREDIMAQTPIVPPYNPYRAPQMSMPYPTSENNELKAETDGAGKERRQTAQSYMDGYASSGGGGGPIQFQQQPVYAADSMSYLNRYGVNV